MINNTRLILEFDYSSLFQMRAPVKALSVLPLRSWATNAKLSFEQLQLEQLQQQNARKPDRSNQNVYRSFVLNLMKMWFNRRKSVRDLLNIYIDIMQDQNIRRQVLNLKRFAPNSISWLGGETRSARLADTLYCTIDSYRCMSGSLDNSTIPLV